jgi:hypothetical protein
MNMVRKLPYILFVIFLTLNVAFWAFSKGVQKTWLNVPSAPSEVKANLSFLGDKQLAYRAYAIMLQNMGSTDGHQMSLKNYDYTKLKNWFFLQDKLDPHSDAVPLLAAYYYGAVADNKKLPHVLDYLSLAGQSPEGEKWRWLGHAVFLARHQMKDNERALELAYLLSENKSPDLADWAKQMPAFILQDEGESDLAYKIMLNILISNVDTMHPNEIFFMKDYICNTIIPAEASIVPPSFCKEIK